MALNPDLQNVLDNFSSKYGKNIQIVSKDKSKLMRMIGWLFSITKISPTFMTDYITTIGETIYIPQVLLDGSDQESLVQVVAHETVHVADSNKLTGPFFKFLYLFPQSLAPLALISLLGIWKLNFLWCLLFLLCLAPIPAPFRYLFELRAYRTQILFAIKQEMLPQDQLEEIFKWIEDQMTTSLYYFTWPFPKMVQKHLHNTDWIDKGIYRDLYHWILVRRAINQAKNRKEMKISSSVEDNQ